MVEKWHIDQTLDLRIPIHFSNFYVGMLCRHPYACHARSTLNLKKCSEPANFWRFWLLDRSRATAWCKFWRHLGQPILRARPFLGADFPSRWSHKTMEKHSISRNSYPPKPPHLTHLSCIPSARSHLVVHRSSAATLNVVGSWIPKHPLTSMLRCVTNSLTCKPSKHTFFLNKVKKNYHADCIPQELRAWRAFGLTLPHGLKQ